MAKAKKRQIVKRSRPTGTEETLAEILVYSCTTDEMVTRVTNETTAYFTKHVPKHPGWDKQLEQELYRQLTPVKYNEVIGAIEVFRLETQLRAEYWVTTKKRVQFRSKTKPSIRWVGKLLEAEYAGTPMTSEEIFRDFRTQLDRGIRGTPSLRSRFVDLEAFDNVGPHVDWRSTLRQPPWAPARPAPKALTAARRIVEGGHTKAPGKRRGG